MYEMRQLEIPPSFMALYTRHGRPSAAREVVEARYEACEDLAHGVAGFCSTQAADDDGGRSAILLRCHAGLLLTPQTLSAAEAGWVTGRTAELLEWDTPPLPDATDDAD
ncbi:MAG: hypothetical protein ABIX46_03455 [Burkholderiaceae bacterium]